jgi:hypothetical protein
MSRLEFEAGRRRDRLLMLAGFGVEAKGIIISRTPGGEFEPNESDDGTHPAQDRSTYSQ